MRAWECVKNSCRQNTLFSRPIKNSQAPSGLSFEILLPLNNSFSQACWRASASSARQHRKHSWSSLISRKHLFGYCFSLIGRGSGEDLAGIHLHPCGIRQEPGRAFFFLWGGGRGSLTFCHPCTTGILPREPRRLHTAASPSVPRGHLSP